ncbi:MAG: hypothetical protein LZT29_03977 [Pantoea stewartii]|nr:MAG: hypothetical protein LZT29_03977 [Pantoea stewartii]
MGFSCGEAGCRIRKQQDAAQQGEDAMQDFSPLQNSAPAYRKKYLNMSFKILFKFS